MAPPAEPSGSARRRGRSAALRGRGGNGGDCAERGGIKGPGEAAAGSVG